jgi:arginase
MTNKINLFYPQWQGSDITPELYYGASTIKEYLELQSASFINVPVSLNTDFEFENNICFYKQILSQLKKAEEIIKNEQPDKIFSIGGGCDIELPIISYLNSKYSNMNVFWLDAHGDLNTPTTSPSHLFHGMPLRCIFENIKDDNINNISINKLPIKNLTMIGTRDLDPEETNFIFKNKIKCITVDEIKTLLYFDSCIKNYAYVHIDLDVLDPSIYKSVKCPAKNGLSIRQLVDTIEHIKKNFNIVGYSILESTETELANIKILDKLLEIGIRI